MINSFLLLITIIVFIAYSIYSAREYNRVVRRRASCCSNIYGCVKQKDAANATPSQRRSTQQPERHPIYVYVSRKHLKCKCSICWVVLGTRCYQAKFQWFFVPEFYCILKSPIWRQTLLASRDDNVISDFNTPGHPWHSGNPSIRTVTSPGSP